jgi:hypothetical protein
MRLSFLKEDLFTVGGFLYESYASLRARFEEVGPDDYHDAFLAEFGAKRQRLADASGAKPGGTSVITRRLYGHMDAAEVLLNRLQIRLDLLDDSVLSVRPRRLASSSS